ncbi:hypothetical protein K2X33_07690 [bacterium]|nr:hypothetical protein [bacterium]
MALSSTFGFAAPAKKADLAWSAKMQQLSATLSNIMPDLVSGKTPDAKALARLKEGATAINRLAHQIDKNAKGKSMAPPPDADPSLAMLSGLFEREAKTALHALQSGSVEYGKASLRMVTNYCVSCHTRTNQGPQFGAVSDKQTKGLTKMERAQLHAATRQFDAALEEFESVISDNDIAKKRQLEWGRAVRHAFTIAIRVKQDPDRALKIVQRVEALPTTPGLFRDFVASWKQSVEDWKKEGKKSFSSEEDIYQEANRLGKAAEAMQKFPMDHSADVLYLRLSLTAHELLTRYPDGKHVSDTLYLLGNAYDLLDDHLISPLPEMYYETCIRRTPHSPASQKCYQRYESNVYFGYTGSAGTSIPDDLAERLKELKEIAATKKG